MVFSQIPILNYIFTKHLSFPSYEKGVLRRALEYSEEEQLHQHREEQSVFVYLRYMRCFRAILRYSCDSLAT